MEPGQPRLWESPGSEPSRSRHSRLQDAQGHCERPAGRAVPLPPAEDHTNRIAEWQEGAAVVEAVEISRCIDHHPGAQLQVLRLDHRAGMIDALHGEEQGTLAPVLDNGNVEGLLSKMLTPARSPSLR